MRIISCALLLVATTLLVPHQSSQASTPDKGAPMCFGKRATIIGQGQATLVGTSRDDVIVTNTASRVLPGEGDDRVCVTGRSLGRVRVIDTAGRDRIRAPQQIKRGVSAELGPGRDIFRGGPGDDEVYGSRPWPVPEGADDDIRTGAGDDKVFVGGLGGLGDRVDLGPGRDVVFMDDDTLVRSGRLDGGTGYDVLSNGTALAGSDITFDTRTGVATSDGATILRFGGFEQYELFTDDAARFRFLGSAVDERLYLLSSGELDGDMGAGDDIVLTRPAKGEGRTTSLSGGPGDNELYLWSNGTLRLDLAAGTGTDTIGPRTSTVGVVGFGYVNVVGVDVELRGRETADRLVARGCTVELLGGAGDDRLRASSADDSFPCLDEPVADRVLVDGESGDDTLVGSEFDDILIGGDGTDSADGYLGTDSCDAESVVRCES